MSKIINGTSVGVVVGFLSAIIAFLLSYNSMIIEIMKNKEDALKYYQNTKNEMESFSREVESIKKDLPITILQYEELINKIEELQESRIYLNEFGYIKNYNPRLQEAIALIHDKESSTDVIKKKIYKLITNGEYQDLHPDLSRKFMSIMDSKDWTAVYDMSKAQNSEFILYEFEVNSSAIPCLETSRSEIFNRAQKDMIKSYENHNILDYDTAMLIRYLSEPGKCFRREDVKKLMAISENYNDLIMLKDFSIRYNKHKD
ncbi:TPA: hypothetical protein ACPJ0P_002448 [Vibrio alginolyticus]